VRLRGRSMAWALLGAQTTTTVIAALVVWAVRGESAAIAALFGGVVAIAPAAWFAVKMYPRHASYKAAEVLGATYRAEVGKLILTASLFWIGVMLFRTQFAPLMLTCIACLSMNWLMLAVARFN
jgi:F0F1-type ATP synthase assembly protein I